MSAQPASTRPPRSPARPTRGTRHRHRRAPRAGPPFHMTDMIAAEPALAGRILGRLADPIGARRRSRTAIRRPLPPASRSSSPAAGRPSTARSPSQRSSGRPPGRPAFAAPRSRRSRHSSCRWRRPSRGLVIGISHEGGTAATNAALQAAHAAGRTTAVITVSGRSPAGALADIVVETGELDQGWCHTVGYLSPILARRRRWAPTCRASDWTPSAWRLCWPRAPATSLAPKRIAAVLADATQLLVIASGADRPAGRELTLKVEEASWLPSAFRDLETFLHGHLPATGAGPASS